MATAPAGVEGAATGWRFHTLGSADQEALLTCVREL
jgi:hypothetical protein